MLQQVDFMRDSAEGGQLVPPCSAAVPVARGRSGTLRSSRSRSRDSGQRSLSGRGAPTCAASLPPCPPPRGDESPYRTVPSLFAEMEDPPVPAFAVMKMPEKSVRYRAQSFRLVRARRDGVVVCPSGSWSALTISDYCLTHATWSETNQTTASRPQISSRLADGDRQRFSSDEENR